MTLNYEISLKLKEIGLEQRGGGGWIVDCDGKKSFADRLQSIHLQVSNTVCRPSISQLLEWLEGKGIDLEFHLFEVEKFDYRRMWQVSIYDFRDNPEDPKYFKVEYETHFNVALAKLIISLKEKE